MPFFFEVENLTFKHPGAGENRRPALKDISLRISEGEWIALIGANGSGKTTLARHLNGLFTPSHGSVKVNGLDTAKSANLPQIRSLVGMVFQSPEDQIVSSLVLEDTAFGPENMALPTDEIKARVDAALHEVRMWDHRDKAPHLLSAGQIQRVALAGVLAMQPRCIIFDETTAILDPMGRQAVLNRMQALHKAGITIVMITHSMDEAILAERVVVLDEGRLIMDGAPSAIFNDDALLQHCHLEVPAFLSANRLLEKVFSLPAGQAINMQQVLDSIPANPTASIDLTKKAKVERTGRSTVVEIVDLQHIYQAGTPFQSQSLAGVSFETIKGRVHGLVGATGSGKSTLLQHLNGLYLPQSGRVRVGDFNLNDPAVDIRALRRYVGIVFQNPEAFFFENYVGDEIAFGPKQLFGREGLRERVRAAMEQVGLDFEEFKDRSTMALSGGEKRKVALASSLALTPGLLVLDEPSAGLDPLSRTNLLHTLKALHGNGLEIILSSHNMDDIAFLAQRMTLLDHGLSLATGTVSQIFSSGALMEQANLIVPPGALFAQRLRAKGWEIAEDCITFSGVEACLQQNVSRGTK
jgi:energy-coupling factor transport system ATP-binding protein